MIIDAETDRHTRQTDRLTDINYVAGQTDIYSDRHIFRQIDRSTDRETDIPTDCQAL